MSAAQPPGRPAPESQGPQAADLPAGSRSWWRFDGRRGTWLALAAVLLLALLVRLAFSFRAPPFVTNDSLSYLLPGFDLIHGAGFHPILKRPPLYPLFVGGVLGLFGEDLRLLMLVQHLLGVLTVLFTYGIGRLLFGAAGGLVAALLTAIGGPIDRDRALPDERGAVHAAADGRAARLPRRGAGAAPGRHAGAAGAGRRAARPRRADPPDRPAHPADPGSRPAVPAAALAAGPARRRWPWSRCSASVVVPWMARNQAVQGTFAIAGGSGEGLAVRTIRYEQRFDFREPPGGDADRTLARARRIYRDEAEDGSAFELRQRLVDELGVSEVEAERLMRTIALQAILRQPGYYLAGTAEMLVTTFVGRPVRLRQDWLPWRNIAWDERVRHLLPEPTAVEERGFAAAERLVTIYDPARVAPLLALLGAVGALSGSASGAAGGAAGRPGRGGCAAGRGRPDRHRVAVPFPARSAHQRPGGRRAGDAGRADPRAAAPIVGLARRAAGHDPGGAGLVRRRRSVWYDIRVDVMALLLLVFGAIVLRVAFFTSAPPFLNPDSAGYYVPGRNLAYGDGFDLGLRRTPTYPLFIAAVVSFVGEDLQKLVTVQHVLFGPLLVALTYLLGRLVASRPAAIVAAALVAISGPLLLYEHYVMTEVPFAILLLALLSATVLATRRASLGWAALAGLLFGALVLCRPSGQILAPVVVGTLLLLMPAAWSRRLLAVGVLAICALAVIVPWMAYNQRTQGVFTIAGSGRFLLARTLKMDPGGFTFPDAPPGVVEDATKAAARRIVQEEAAASGRARWRSGSATSLACPTPRRTR